MTAGDARVRQAVAACVFALAAALVSAGLMTLAVLAAAPPIALPGIVLVCIGAPVVAAWELPDSVAVLRAIGLRRRAQQRAISRLSRELERLPETDHPLGL